MSFRGLMNMYMNYEEASTVSDDMGGNVETWAVVYRNLHCRMQPYRGTERGQERIAYDKDTTMATAVVYTPYKSGILESGRFTKGSRIFEIKLIGNVDEANKYLRIEVEEVK